MSSSPTVFIVDDDAAVRNAVSMSLTIEGFVVEEHDSATSFLRHYNNQPGCLILDIQMPNLNGLDLQEELVSNNIKIPIIFITGHGDIPMSVKALKAGAVDFIEKPFNKELLLSRVNEAIEIDTRQRLQTDSPEGIDGRFRLLTPQEIKVMRLLISHHAKLSNQDIANELNISRQTVEEHRSCIMSKMQANSRADLVEMAKFCFSS